MNQVLVNWLENIKKYPPSEIFFEKYGKEAKAEKRIQEVCEDLYRFNYPDNQINYLGELQQAYRDFEVLVHLGLDGIKPEYILKTKNALVDKVKAAITAYEAMCKKDQLLQANYQPWKVKFQEIQSILYDMTKDFV
jgi:hypothetical protein